MKDVVRLVAVILVCQLPPFPRQLPPETSAENTRELMMMMMMTMMMMVMMMMMIVPKTAQAREFCRKYYASKNSKLTFGITLC